MKVVVVTQVMENYAAHNGFTGEYAWKYKMGETYVIDNVDPNEFVEGSFRGSKWEQLNAAIETDGDSWREYIIDTLIVDNDAPEGEPWDTPFRLSYVDGRWVATRTIDNQGEYGGWMRRDIATKTETYVMGLGGERLEYAASWTLTNGSVANTEDELRALLEQKEAA